MMTERSDYVEQIHTHTHTYETVTFLSGGFVMSWVHCNLMMLS